MHLDIISIHFENPFVLCRFPSDICSTGNTQILLIANKSNMFIISQPRYDALDYFDTTV